LLKIFINLEEEKEENSMLSKLRLLSLMLLASLIISSQAHAEKFTFGVMSDTQWSGTDPTGRNVNTVAVNQINACNNAFINAGVDFVVQVGDLCDSEGSNNAALQTRLNANAALNAANIPFYGLRGNHESSAAAATFFKNNYLPSGTSVAVAPDGISYAVTHNNTKIVLLDYGTAGNVTALNTETSWMNAQLAANDHEQGFVFSHKNLLGQNHKDNEFGSANDSNPTQQNAFISTLQNNGVRYAISGHDHMHYRSEVTSPDGQSSVEQIISGSDSYKYYLPGTPSSSRDNPFAQQLNTTGYYIYTVDGPRVTGQYYASTPLSNGDVNPAVPFTLQETFGYSLNGEQFVIGSGASLSAVQDTYNTTSMHLSGTNTSAVKDYLNRLVSKDINTGWTDKTSGFASDILTLWGMEDVGGTTTASPFTLTMNYSASLGDIYLARQNSDGTWGRLNSTINGDGTISALLSSDGAFAVIPEPATMILLGLGSLLFARKRSF
jgi:hypothetical protein